MREELSSELAASINEFGPKMYEDFDQVSVSGGDAPCGLEFDYCVLVEDSGAIRQRTAVNRYTRSVEKEKWCWCCRRPRKPTCPPHGKLCRKVYCRQTVLISVPSDVARRASLWMVQIRQPGNECVGRCYSQPRNQSGGHSRFIGGRRGR